MDDSPYINDGADASLRKAVSLLNKIEAKTGSGSGPASGTVALDAASLNALENISVTFPATQNVNVTNAGLNVSVSNFPAIQPVSIASAPVTPVTDNGGSLTVDGSITANQATAASLKAQAQLLNAAGSVVDYAMTGAAGTPATDVVTVQGISGGTVIPVSVSNLPGTQAVSGTFWPTTQPVSGSVSVSNFPATQAVTLASPPVTPVTDNGGSLTVDGTFWPATQPVSGTVSVSNFPATQPVSGSISVSNFPGTQPVSGTFWPTTQPVSGSVSVSNFPAIQPVSIASAPVTPVTDNGGSLTVDGSITATQSTASSLKAQAQLLNAAGTVVEYATTGSAGTPAADVVSVQGVAGGTAIPVSLATAPTTPVTDNGGSLTVDGTITSRLADGAGNSLTSVARGSERALSVQIVDASGAQVTTFGGGGGGGSSGVGTTGEATVTSFSSLSSGTLKAANANRKMLTIFNEGLGTLFILYGNGTASTTNYSLRLLGGDYLEVDKYTGVVVGIFGGNGIAKITEIT